MRKIIINLLSYLGYGLIKIPGKKIIKRNKIVNIGKFQLEIPSINPLSYTYSQNLDFSLEITRIASAIFKKYPDMHAVDVGANIGDTFLRIKNVDESIPVTCIEGDSFSFSFLKKNASGHDPLLLLNNFLGERNSSINISFEKKGWNTTLIPDSNATEIVEFVTIDHLAATKFTNNDKVKFIKIDTEGFDTIILRGAMQVLSKAKPVIYMEYNKDNMQALHEDGLSTVLSLKEIGYKKIMFFDDTGKFMLMADLFDTDLINGMDSYISGKSRLVTYYNLCLFSENDIDIAEEIGRVEITVNRM